MKPAVDEVKLYIAQRIMSGACAVCGATIGITTLTVDYNTVDTVHRFNVPLCFATAVRWDNKNLLSYSTLNKIYRRMKRIDHDYTV